MMSGPRGWSSVSQRCVMVYAATMLVYTQATLAQSTASPSAPTAGAAKLSEYEVVSIKENKKDDGMVRMMNTPDGFTTENMSLNNLISNAYGVRYDLISGGPGWANSRGFDITAKVAGADVEAYKNFDDKGRLAMMQALLKERFNLQAHIEKKELPVYDLEIAKGGVKMKLGTPDPPPDDAGTGAKPDALAKRNGMMRMSSGTMNGTGLGMMQIAGQLSYIVHHPVRDKTGLTGIYDVELKWADEYAHKQDNGSADSAPSIFTAVQEQLGLKLESTKGPVDTLVIDHVELPSEN